MPVEKRWVMGFGVTVDFNANVAKFDKQVDKLGNNLDKFGKKTESSFGLAKAAAVGFISSLAAARTVSFINDQIDAADQVQKLSIRLGASTEALSQYKFVAEQTGTTFNALVKGWEKQGRGISEAALGMGLAKRSLDELGLSAKELQQIAPEEQFEILAEEINKLTNQSDKIRIANDLWGRSGGELLQVMENGAQGIRELRDEADKLNLTLSQDQVNAAANANDALNELSKSMTGGLTQAVLDNVTQIETLADSLKTGIPAAVNFTVDSLNMVRATITFATESFVKFNATLLEYANKLPFATENNKELEKTLKSIGESLEETRHGFFNAANARDKDTESVINATEKTKDNTVSIDVNRKAKEESEKASKKLADAQDKQANSSAQRLFENTRTSLEKLNTKQAEYKKLLDAGKISQDTFNRAMLQSKKIMSEASGADTESLSLSEQAAKRQLDWERKKLELKIKQAEIDKNNSKLQARLSFNGEIDDPRYNKDKNELNIEPISILTRVLLPTKEELDRQLAADTLKDLGVNLKTLFDEEQAIEGINKVQQAAQAAVSPIVIPVLYEDTNGNTSSSPSSIDNQTLAGGTRS